MVFSINFDRKGTHTIFYGWRILTRGFLARWKEKKNKICFRTHVGRRKKINLSGHIWFWYATTKDKWSFLSILIVRARTLYSTVDGSWQGAFWLIGKKKIKNKICLWTHVGRRKKIKGKFSEICLFIGVFKGTSRGLTALQSYMNDSYHKSVWY